MSYTALYRRWRPATFDEVVGQQAVCRTLKNQIKSGRIGHAYLFCGTRGTGKTSLAKIMARAVNCENPVNGEPCNKCPVCMSILNDSSMNVIELDAASNNGVDDVRAIKEQTSYPPAVGKYRVFIIDEVHMLSVSAFNALLKTLEEPPGYVIFILATTEAYKIPVTVASRCQRYDLRRIETAAMVQRMKFLCNEEKIDIEEKALEYTAKRADGAMRDALSLLDECAAFKAGEAITYEDVLEILGTADTGIFNELFEAILGNDVAKALYVLDEAFMQGKEAGRFVSDFIWYMRNLLIIKSAADYKNLVDISAEMSKSMSEYAKRVSKSSLMRYIRIFSELANRLRSSESKRVMVELATIKLCTPQMDLDKDAVFERISDIESSIEKLSAGYGSFNTDIPLNENDRVDKTNDKEKKPLKKVLPKAEYDDFMMLRGDWSRLIEEIGASVGSFFKDTYIEPVGREVLNIVFTQKEYYAWANREDYLDIIKEKVMNKYGREFEFKIRLADEYEIVNTQYLSQEDLLNNEDINMDIEIEKDKIDFN